MIQILTGIILSFCIASSAFAEGRFRNLSTLGLVDSNGLAAGFILEGDQVVRVVVSGERYRSEIDPVVSVTNVAGTVVFGTNDQWQSSASAGAISAIIGRDLDSTEDAALVLDLEPGTYVAFLQSANTEVGDGIIAISVR